MDGLPGWGEHPSYYNNDHNCWLSVSRRPRIKAWGGDLGFVRLTMRG